MTGTFRAVYERSLREPEQFWAEAAGGIDWHRKWEKVLDDSRKPFYRWFAGGELNTCYNALDRHIERGRGNQLALVYDSPVTGAIHSVVFGGFAPRELATRIDDAKPKVIISASCGIELSRAIPYKPLLDEAIRLSAHKPSTCIIVERPQAKATLVEGRDLLWDQALEGAPTTDCVPVAATDPLYVLYTSGTTGQPKGIVRDNGGHAV